MKIEIRNLKFSAFASQDSNCFQGTIYIDGKKEGDVRNDGHGGSPIFNPPSLTRKLAEHAATLPHICVLDRLIPVTASYLIEDMVEKMLRERDLKKRLTKHVMFTIAGKAGVFQLRAMKADVLRTTLENKALLAKLGADKILNLLPLEEALVVFKAANVSSAV